MRTVDVPIKDPKKPPRLKFPDRCVSCGKPKSRTWPVKLNTGAQKNGRMTQLEFNVPMCARCAAKENRVGTFTWIPFFIAGLLICGAVFVPVALLAPEGSNSNTLMLPYVLGAFAGLIAGAIAGTLVESGLKLLLTPIYGQLLLKRPLTVLSILNDSEDLIGLSTRFAQNRALLKITFENDEVADEFISLNPQEYL